MANDKVGGHPVDVILIPTENEKEAHQLQDQLREVLQKRSIADDSTVFDVPVQKAPDTDSTYLTQVEEDEPERELADDNLEKEPALQTPPKRVEFTLPKASAMRQVPAFFPPAMIPKGIVFPKGIEAVFMKLPAETTAARHKGDRFLIMWATSEGDEKLALGRSMGDSNRIGGELTKQSIRAIDGHVADWSGVPTAGSVDAIWREIGAKGRNLLTRLFLRVNTLSQEESIRFFEECIAVVPTG